MSGAWALAAREFMSYFRTPIGWLVGAVWLLIGGVVFVESALVPGEAASMRGFFAAAWALLVVVAPALSMRSLSEELRTGTIEPLMSAPVGEWALVLGKYLGALGFLVVCLVPTLAYVAVLTSLAAPDPGPIAAGYLGVTLTGGLYLALGVLLSGLTASQTLAFLSTLFALLVVEVGLGVVAPYLPEAWARAALALSINRRAADFARGLIDLWTVGYFLVAILWALGLSAITLRARRWR
ncbi:MAG: hypothetical protein C0475_03385 [Planctomyces sp.]|nr:hypothetical protein [Planctomyces sp.]MBA4039060.1 hypothetical protein [Planctomyces sp.]MBA4119484.1 hypothetical protein [Isosphaera sp.]